MATPDHIRKDAESALKDIDALRREITEFVEFRAVLSELKQSGLPAAIELSEFQARVSELIDRIRGMLESLRSEPGGFRSPAAALPLTALAQELKAELEWLESILSYLEGMFFSPADAWRSVSAMHVSGSVSAALSKVRGYLIPQIKRFLSKLWSLISGLLTPKEWKLKGQVGTGLLGLANVEVEITFGP